MNLVWKFERSVIPNNYLKTPSANACAQNVYFCENCFYIKNDHSFSVEQIYANYAYRSPKSGQDDKTIEFLNQKRSNELLKLGETMAFLLKNY